MKSRLILSILFSLLMFVAGTRLSFAEGIIAMYASGGTLEDPGYITIKNGTTETFIVSHQFVNSCAFSPFALMREGWFRPHSMIYNANTKQWQRGVISLACEMMPPVTIIAPGDSIEEPIPGSLPAGRYHAQISFRKGDDFKTMETRFVIEKE